MILIDYITNNGEGVWNTLARSAGPSGAGLRSGSATIRRRCLLGHGGTLVLTFA
ncbi:hypothetical protein QJS10_CPA03g00375 [Acorus calamus]|uniref:Uncharacterized protein n=1 Tax=Acorus calamus TaxID=4465 RepID=A0AAV9F9R3_ACOCL|nr:hypothetical protein QJS10_CPA03g00375 [Acorus calamus]